MKVELIIPIERLRGKLKQDGYYFRQYRGQQIVQRCPTKWKDTPARKAAREKFAAKYAGNHRQVNNPKQDPDAGLKSGVNEQSNKPLKERKKENGKDHDDVRDCVYIGTRGELLLQDDEGDREGVHAPGKGRKAKVKSQETCERGDGAAAEAV